MGTPTIHKDEHLVVVDGVEEAHGLRGRHSY